MLDSPSTIKDLEEGLPEAPASSAELSSSEEESDEWFWGSRGSIASRC